MKIVLDPGHGQYGNPYPPRPGYYEGTQMWKLANFLKVELEKYGFEVITTRPRVTDFPSLVHRGQMSAGAELYLSLHTNAPASASDTKPTGSVVFYSMSTPSAKALADKIGKRISEVMGHHYRGSMIKESGSRPGIDYNGGIRNAIASGCKVAMLVEHGFHTNVKDSAFLIVDDNLRKLAVAEAEVIAEFYGKGDKSMTLYRGIKGDEVKKLQQDLIRLGYDLSPYGADGSFGSRTETVVMAFQKDHGLQVDGRVGPATKAKLKELREAQDAPKAPVEDPRIKELQAKVIELQAEIKKYKDHFDGLKSLLS